MASDPSMGGSGNPDGANDDYKYGYYEVATGADVYSLSLTQVWYIWAPKARADDAADRGSRRTAFAPPPARRRVPGPSRSRADLPARAPCFGRGRCRAAPRPGRSGAG